jgi:hypothetical protein
MLPNKPDMLLLACGDMIITIPTTTAMIATHSTISAPFLLFSMVFAELRSDKYVASISFLTSLQ